MAVSTTPSIFYEKRELNNIAKVLRQMSDIAVAETKRKVQELAQKELDAIRRIASSRGKVADRIAQGGQVKASSLLGEIQFGFASPTCAILQPSTISIQASKGLTGLSDVLFRTL